MPKFERVPVLELDSRQRKQISALLEPRYHSYLDRDFITLQAWNDETLEAVAFYRIHPVNQSLEVLNLSIAPESINEDLIDSTIEILEDTAKELDCTSLYLIYQGGGELEPLIDTCFEKRGWDDPENYQIRCTFDSSKFDAPWLNYLYKLPLGYEIFPWQNLKSSERAELKELEGGIFCPYSVSPFHNEEQISLPTSFGLRADGKVVGWLITHLTSPDMLRYDSFWTLPGHRAFGPTVKMLAEAIKVHIRKKIPYGEAEANYTKVDHRWISFFERRLVPFSIKVERLYSATKFITS